MFGKIFKKGLETIASSNNNSILSGLDLNSINENRNKVKENKEDINKKYSLLYNAGLDSLEKYLSNSAKEKIYLKNSILKFIECIELKKNKPDPFFYLSYIAYINRDIVLAKKYLKILELLDPNYLRLSFLKKKIFSLR